MDNPFKSPAILSMCPGFLGLERGLVRAIGKIRVVAYVEIEAFIIANLVAGMEAGVLDSAPIWTDAKTFDAQPFRGKIHGIIGGYPCPGESLAGLREGHLYKGFLWPAFRKIIAAARPIFCFFENVDDHLTGTYPIVQRSLRNMGYAVEAGVYSAEEAGATIEANRLFILAVASSYLDELRRKFRNVSGPAKTFKGKAREQNGQRVWDEFGNIGKEMGATMRKRFEGQQRLDRKQDHRTIITQKRREIIRASAEDFPMPQGAEQWKWEAPRTIESSMGYTTERYNFREDILRANGNMVPEQQSELAFRDLISKHGLEHLIEWPTHK